MGRGGPSPTDHSENSDERFPSKFEGPGDSPGFLLWQVTNGWQRAIRRALHGTNLTHVQFVLLTSIDWLNKAGTSPTQREIARFAHTDVMMTSQVVRALEAKGWVTVRASETDSRAHMLDVTSEGHELVREALKLVEDADAMFFGPLGNDLKTFLRMLRALSDRTNGNDDDDGEEG
jgi:MarR family transcriptional regulator, organic hydroperoxide resistance regulator